MKIKDAIQTLTFRKKKPEKNQLFTTWGEAVREESEEPDYIPLPDYPRPQLIRDNFRILNGWWSCRMTERAAAEGSVEAPDSGAKAGGEACGQPQVFWEGRILVPFSPESALSGVGHQLQPGQRLWYEREVLLTREELTERRSRKGRLLLHFGAVDQACFVWWNGVRLGEHHGGYLPFTFDVTDYLQECNTVQLEVWDDSDTSYHARGKQTLTSGGMFYTAQSGIWQTVWMEWVPQSYVEELRIVPDYDSRSVRAELVICADGQKHREVRERTVAEEEFHPWSPEQPYLYEWELQVGEDRIVTYFAMRKITTQIDEAGIPRIFLNDVPYYQHGVLDQGYWPDGLMTPPSDEAFVFDITSMKKAGFNMLRKHIKVEPLRWYYHCDRLGMLVWQDMVNGGGQYDLVKLSYLPTPIPWLQSHMKDNKYSIFAREELNGRREWLTECRQTVRHLFNCPSICLWVPFNEGWGQFEAKRVTEMIGKLDATRLIDHASGWVDQGCGDVKSIHNYFQRFSVKPDRGVRTAALKRPVVYSEYGGYACYVKEHSYSNQIFGYRRYETQEAFAEAFGRLQQKIAAMRADGLCADVYTQLSDVEDEVNGILTYDRRINKLEERSRT